MPGAPRGAFILREEPVAKQRPAAQRDDKAIKVEVDS
jgi:hypothetical protein